MSLGKLMKQAAKMQQQMEQIQAQIVEDMILSATNQALAQAKDISNAEMGKATAGFNLPGLM